MGVRMSKDLINKIQRDQKYAENEICMDMIYTILAFCKSVVGRHRFIDWTASSKHDEG